MSFRLRREKIAARSPSLSLVDVEKSFYNPKTGQKQVVLNKVSMAALSGEVTVLLGQSGSGKSTLFRILIGEEFPDAGCIEILERNIAQAKGREIEEIKKQFGILFQYGALFNSMTVAENIAFPIVEHQPQLHPNIIQIMVDTKLRQVELEPDVYRDKSPAHLSGGERKRVGLARALALDPKLIFYDEPSAGLDPIVSRTIDKLIKDLVHILGISSVVITHELDSAFAIADRMVLLKRAVKEHGDTWDGTIVYEEGTPEELKNSRNSYTVEFLGEFSYHDICLKCRSLQEKDFKKCSQCGDSKESPSEEGNKA